MIELKRTNSDHPDFKKLVRELDIDLKDFYKEELAFYNELNDIEKIKYVVVAYEQNIPVGCGGIKQYANDVMEVKRMYVPPINRGKGIASMVLTALENWSKELEFKKCVLETLKEKDTAISFYQKNNYNVIPNFGAYVEAKNSICFEKIL